MAKVTGPLFSMSASGKLGNALVFGNWKGKNTVREWLKPANPKSSTQGDVRLIMGGLAKACAPVEVESAFYDRVLPLTPSGQSWISYLIQYARNNLYNTTTLYNAMITAVQGHTAYSDWQDGADDANLNCFDIAYAGTAEPFEKAAQLYAIAETGFSLGFTSSPFDTALASWTDTEIDALVAEFSA